MANSENNSIPLLINVEPVNKNSTDLTKKTSSEFRYIGVSGLFLLLMLIILPFMFGGRDPVVASFIKITFFVSVLASFINQMFFKKKIESTVDNRSNKTIILFLPLLSYLIFQIVPLPLSLLAFLSPNSATAYRLTGAEYGYVSLEPFSSIFALSWLLVFALLFNSLLNVPYNTATIDKKRRKSKSTKIVYFSENSREFDMFSELIQVVLIRVSLICAIIGISHLVLQMNSLFGIYSYAPNVEITSRAHWPFVNANQLAFIIEIGLLLSVTRFFRERQIKGLSLVASEDKSLLLAFKDFLSLIERQASLLISILVLSIGLFLTMSRAGIILSVFGISVLWFFYKLRPVKLVSKKTNTNRSSNRSFSPFILKVIKLISAPVLIISLVLLFIGGEATHDLSERVDETYIQSGSAPRAALNLVTWKVFSENPIWGVGLNNWKLVASNFSEGYVVGWKLDYAHNDYFQLLSEVGLIGLMLGVFPIYYGIRKLLKVIRLNLGQVRSCFLLGLFLSFMVPAIHAAVDFPFHLPFLSFSIFATLVIFTRTCVYFSLKNETTDKE